MKLISFVVPSYNSEQYLNKCIDSLLVAGEQGEIIIVNDGSTDNTSKIAHQYEDKYPTIVKVIDKPNGGHGSGVNAGLSNATGLYFKVVDSDDWLDGESLTILLDTINKHMGDTLPDLYVTNLVKENVGENTSQTLKFNKFFPKDQIVGWDKVKRFGLMDVLLMHNLVYKTQVLRDYGLKLPEHTFYVDTIVSYNPLPLVKTLYFLDLPLYRYYIGRSDQSICAENITKRYEQQIRVMLNLVSGYTYDQIKAMPKPLKKYMLHYISSDMCLTVMFTTAGKDNKLERKTNLKNMWQAIKEHDLKIYKYLRHRSVTGLINWMPFSWQGKITWIGYKIVCKVLDY